MAQTKGRGARRAGTAGTGTPQGGDGDAPRTQESVQR